MSGSVDQAAARLNETIAQASRATDFVFGTAERLSAAPVSTLAAIVGGSAGMLLAFALGVAAPAFASGLVLLGGFTLGGSASALVSRKFGPAARRLRLEEHREEIELRRQHTRYLTETWKQLPDDRPDALINAISREIERTVALPDASRRLALPAPETTKPEP